MPPLPAILCLAPYQAKHPFTLVTAPHLLLSFHCDFANFGNQGSEDELGPVKGEDSGGR